MKKQKRKQSEKKPISLAVAKMLDVPKMVVSKAPNIEFSGNNEVVIDTCQNILEYTETRVKISSGSLIIVLCGTNFEIKELSESGIIIDGFVKTMEFIE